MIRPFVLSLAALLLLGLPAHAKDFLGTNEFIKDGQTLVAPNRAFHLMQQGDGNLCVYRGEPGNVKPGGPLWCSMRTGGTGKYFAVQQGDGNLCTYRGTGPGDNKGVLWCSGQAAGSGSYFVAQQGDGNLCTYRGTGPGDNRGRVWCTTVTEAPSRMPVCTTKGCGVAEPQFAAGTWGKHNCSGLTTPMLRAHCEERNGKWAAVEAKCAPRKGSKSHNACLKENNPAAYSTFSFSESDFLNCERSVRTECRNTLPDWMLWGAGGKGQMTSCSLTPMSAACADNMRIYKLCEGYLSAYYREECVIRARKFHGT